MIRLVGLHLRNADAHPPAAARVRSLSGARRCCQHGEVTDPVATWRAAWERLIPFLAFAPEVRRIIDTTNAIESLTTATQDHQEPRSLPTTPS